MGIGKKERNIIMKNKNGYPLGSGECPCNCNDEVACDWFGSHWVNCHIFKRFMEKENGRRNELYNK